MGLITDLMRMPNAEAGEDAVCRMYSIIYKETGKGWPSRSACGAKAREWVQVTTKP